MSREEQPPEEEHLVLFGHDGILFADAIQKLRQDQKRREERADQIRAEIERLKAELEELTRK